MYFCNSGTGNENEMMQYVSTGNPHKGKKNIQDFEPVSALAIKTCQFSILMWSGKTAIEKGVR